MGMDHHLRDYNPEETRTLRRYQSMRCSSWFITTTCTAIVENLRGGVRQAVYVFFLRVLSFLLTCNLSLQY